MLDDKSEIIAHFIGIFELNLEAARMKIKYQELQAHLHANPDLGPLFNVTINVTSEYGLQDYVPEVSWRIPPALSPNPPFVLTLPPAPVEVLPVDQGFTLGWYFNPPLWSPGAVGGGDPIFFVPFPSSVATVTVQNNWLQDYDRLINYDADVAFYAPQSFEAAVQDMAKLAGDLQPLTTPDMPEDETAIVESVTAVLDEIADFTLIGPSDGPAEIHLAVGEGALSLTVNGADADEMLELQDVSLVFAPPEEVEESETEATGPIETPADLPESNGPQEATGEEITSEDPPTDEDEGAPHDLSTGGNVLLNDSYIASDWLDASVIAVQGYVMDAKVVSQVNVWNDVDMINGIQTASAAGSTESFNAVQFQSLSNPKPLTPEQEAEGGSGPQFVAISKIDGNVINYNYVKQFNFAMDSDVVSVRFDANETMIETGGNTLANGYSFLGLGFHYDLIVVGGNMIDMTFVSQTNVMLDSDYLHHGAGFGGDIESSNNLLFNWASLQDVGVDQNVAMNETFQTAADRVMDGDTDIGSARDDTAFEHSEILRVLHITGDVIDVQVMEQVNVLGDADQVAWASETVQHQDGADVSVTTGENELINMASVVDAGIDSTIYTAEGAYTETFLYQADFISEEDPLLAADTDLLTGEAFLFLADGLLGPEEDGEDSLIAAAPAEETSVDIMQSVLA